MTTAKGYKGVGMEGMMTRWYANSTGRNRRRFVETADRIAERTRPGADVLEVAPGPGYLALDLAQRGFHVAALDISRSFVAMVRQRAAQAGVRLDVRHGSADAMPFAAATFDYVVCTAAFKNFSDPLGAINEMHRVLRPGGEAAIVDLRREVAPEETRAAVKEMNLSGWNRWVTGLTFRRMLIPRAYTREQIEDMARASRFGGGTYAAGGIGFELRLKRDA